MEKLAQRRPKNCGVIFCCWALWKVLLAIFRNSNSFKVRHQAIQFVQCSAQIIHLSTFSAITQQCLFSFAIPFHPFLRNLPCVTSLYYNSGRSSFMQSWNKIFKCYFLFTIHSEPLLKTIVKYVEQICMDSDFFIAWLMIIDLLSTRGEVIPRLYSHITRFVHLVHPHTGFPCWFP